MCCAPLIFCVSNNPYFSVRLWQIADAECGDAAFAPRRGSAGTSSRTCRPKKLLQSGCDPCGRAITLKGFGKVHIYKMSLGFDPLPEPHAVHHQRKSACKGLSRSTPGLSTKQARCASASLKRAPPPKALHAFGTRMPVLHVGATAVSGDEAREIGSCAHEADDQQKSPAWRKYSA